MCPARLWGDPTGLLCGRADAHDATAVGGHTYAASESGDGHTAEPEQEAGS